MPSRNANPRENSTQTDQNAQYAIRPSLILEVKRGPQLKDSRLTRAKGLTELGIDLIAVTVKARRRIDEVELRMVEEVECLNPDSETARLGLAQRNSLHECHVHVVDTRTSEVHGPACPKGPFGGHRERRGVEPLRKGLGAAIRIHTRDAVRTRQNIRSADIPQNGTRHLDGRGESARRRVNSRQFPVIENSLDHWIGH